MSLKQYMHRLIVLTHAPLLICCSVSPPPRSGTSSKGGSDSTKSSNQSGGDNTQGESLSCGLTASEETVQFGSVTTLALTTSETPTSVTIDGLTLDPRSSSIRYTPKTGGTNTAVVTITSGVSQATCRATIEAKPPPLPQSTSCVPTYNSRAMGTAGVWLGADVGHSFNLSGNRTLSLYGDTYLGPMGLINRFGSQIVGSTIGISSCDKGVFTTTLHWLGSPPAAKPFFENSDKSFDRYWSTNLPWKTSTSLYIPLSAIQNTKTNKLGFQSLRTDVAIISNPDEAPSKWNVVYKPFFNISSFTSPTSQSSSNFWGGIYNVPFGDYVFFYNNSGNDLTMSRISIASLAKDPQNPASLLEYLAKDGTWKSGYTDADAKRLGISANTSLSVRYNFKQKKWLMVYFDTSSWISPKIYLRKAEQIEGPWTEKIAIYDVPEVTPGKPEYDKRHFCYQAFDHAAFNSDPDNQLAITYACNADDLNYVAGNMKIYFPKFVKIAIPQ